MGIDCSFTNLDLLFTAYLLQVIVHSLRFSITFSSCSPKQPLFDPGILFKILGSIFIRAKSVFAMLSLFASPISKYIYKEESDLAYSHQQFCYFFGTLVGM